MVYQLHGRKNIYIIRNVITLQIIPRYKIPGNNNFFKVKSMVNFCFEGNRKLKKVPFQKFVELGPTLT